MVSHATYTRGSSTRSSSRIRDSPARAAGGSMTGVNGRPGGDVAEVRAREIERAGRIDVARKRERRVRRVIVGAEKLAHFVQLQPVQVLDLTDRRPVVRMIRRKQRREHRHAREAVRPVLVVLAPFVQHHVALVRELGFGQRRQQKPHAIGFHPERQLQRVRGHNFPVVGAIRIGRSIQRGARAL